MSNQPFGGLLWNSQAGVLVQATDLAAKRDRSNHAHKNTPDAERPRKWKRRRGSSGLPGPGAAIALVLVGCILGAAFVGSFTA